jgi:hypothetical protein
MVVIELIAKVAPIPTRSHGFPSFAVLLIQKQATPKEEIA